MDKGNVHQLRKFIGAKDVIATGLFPISYTQLITLAGQGKVPSYPIPGTGKKVNWWFVLEELYDFFSKNGGKVKVAINGINKAKKRPQTMGSRLAGRWV